MRKTKINTMTDDEKAFIKPCVGCGFCCIKSRCAVSLRLWGNNNNDCPALIWDETRYICNLMTKEGMVGAEYRIELYAGEGCCCGLNSWRHNVQPRREKDTEKTIVKYKLSKEFAAFVQAFAGNFISRDLIELTIMGMKHRLEKIGVSQSEMNAIESEIRYHIQNFRHDFMKEFMGQIKTRSRKNTLQLFYQTNSALMIYIHNLRLNNDIVI